MDEPRVNALVVGVDVYPYLDPDRRLRGAVADAHAMAALLRDRIQHLDLATLIDNDATRTAVLNAFDGLVSSTDTGDEALLYWSGHGSQVPNQPGTDEEEDGWDESLVPYDSGRGQHPNRDIVDDEIYERLKALNETTDRVTVILDSCHSGTAVRTGVRGLPRDLRNAGTTSRVRTRPGEHELPRGASGWLPLPNSEVRYLLLAACRDDQEALELPFRGQMRGAFTWALCRELERTRPGATWGDVFMSAASDIAFSTMGAQIPQIEGASKRRLPWTS